MAYQIVNSRGDTIAVIPSGTVNTNATSLTLFGANYPQYGLGQNENFVYLTENFANSTAPDNAIVGQIWFNTALNRLYVYNTDGDWVVLADEAYVQAQKVSPVFTGIPQAPTVANASSSTTVLATTEFVQNAINVRGFAANASPTFTGIPRAPTAATSTATTQLATTEFVNNLIFDLNLSPYATKASPTFTGIPVAPTAPANTSSGQIATTAFVTSALGILNLDTFAPKASPALTGVPTTPTAANSTANTQIASTAFVVNRLNDQDLTIYATKVSPTLSGIPTAPTASASTNTQQIATTSFVQAQKVSPQFTGVPTAPTAASTTANTQIATTAFVSNLVANVPVNGTSELAGSIKLWVSAAPPQGWALCNGEAVSRATYATLFSRIGTTFGAGDGTTTFNLPNLSARFPIGVGVGFPAGTTGGSADAVVVSHSHTGSTDIAGNHIHPMRAQQNAKYFFEGGEMGMRSTIPMSTANVTQTVDYAGNHSHSFTTSSAGQSGTNANLPPYQAFYYIIRMSDEGTGGGTIQAGTAIDIVRNGGFSVINNTGVTRLIAGTGVTLSSETGNITINSSGGGGTADIAGSIKLWGGSTEPTDWMFCDGRALSRDAYPSLFAKIGTTYGAGDGTTTFNLPNITNRFAVGAGGLYANGATGGSADAVVVSHGHTLNDPGHNHSTTTVALQIVTGGPSQGTQLSGSNTTGTSTTGISINSAGESGTNKNLPPYLGLRYIIKINDNGTQRSGAGGGDTSRAGDIKWVAYAQANFPPGWQLCDGTALVRASYPALFARIGTTYGAGNGNTTFNVPDLRGRFIVSEISGATGASRASVNRGNVGGDANAVVVSHTHTASSSPHQHSFSGYNGFGVTAYGTVTGQPNMGTWNPQTNSTTHVLTSPATVSVTVDSAGSSGTNANMPPYVTMVAIIKLDDDSVNTGGILQAGPGISLTTSGAYTTITNTAQQPPAIIAGRGITTSNTSTATIVNANVAGIVAGNNVTISDNGAGVFTITSTASGGGVSGISSVTAQAPLNASTSGGAVTLSLSGTVITTGNQTFNGEKTFVNAIRGAGGVICNSYNFSDTSSSVYWTGSEINLNVAGLMRFYVRSDKAGFSYSTVEKVGGGSFASYSDQRYKQDIVVYDKGLNEIKTLVPQKFRYTREFMRAKKPSKEFVGLIAQMVETGPFASCVSTDENGYKTVDVSELTFALINAVKELSDRIEKLESK